MRIARFVLIGFAAVLLLAVALLAIVVLTFDPNAHKDQLRKLVHDKTGRELALPGDLKLKLYPWLALEMGRASLGNAPGFGAAPMVEFEHARLGVRLLPLLHRKLEIGAVSLESPVIRLAVDKAGHNNWSDLGGQGTAAPEPQGGGANTEISIARLQIVHGELHYSDLGAGNDVAVQGLDLDTGALAPGQPFDLQLAGTVQKGKSLQVALRLKGRVTLDPQHDRYQVADPLLNLQLSGAGLPAAGLPVEVHLAAIDADLKAQTLKLPGLQLRAAGATLSGALEGTKILDAPQFSGPVQLEPVVLRTLLKNLGTELPVTRDPAVFGKLDFKGNLAAGSSAAMLSGLTLHFDDTTASGRAGLSDLASSALAFDLRLDRINADRYLPPVAAKAAPGAAAATAPTPIPVELIRGLNVHGNLSLAQAVFAGIQYGNLHVGLNAGGGKLRVFPSEAQMYGGQYHGDINVDASGRVPRVSFDEHVTGIDFAPLFRDMFETKKVSGRGNAAIKAAGTGADTAALLRTLTGTLDFHVDNGAFEGTDLWYEIRRARALLRKQSIPERTGPERTAFTALAATGRITNGVLASDDLLAALQYLQVKGRGTADLAAGTLDFHLDAAVLKMPAEGSDAAEMKDIVGLQVPISVTGTFAAPKVRPDLAGLVKARVQQEIDKRKDEVKQKLQDKLQDKLKGLFGN